MSSSKPIWAPSGQINDVEIRKTQTLYQGHYQLNRYELRHHQFAGGWGPWLVREHLVRQDATGILLYDPETDKVVMVEQFRVGPLNREDQPSPWLLEIPAGLNDGDKPSEVAIKEVQEETGLTVRELCTIGQYYTTPGAFTEKLFLFCGIVDATQAGGLHGLQEEGEDIKVVVLSFEEIWELLHTDLVTSSSTYIALQWLALNRAKLRQGSRCEKQNGEYPI